MKIGFLGAGTILVTGRKQIKGLTTAATLWVTACMGMAIGGGYLIIGITCFCLVMISNVVLLNLSKVVEEYSKYVSLYIEVEKNGGVKMLNKWIADQGITLSSMTKSKEKTLQPSHAALIVDLDFDTKTSHKELIRKLNTLDYVGYVEEI